MSQLFSFQTALYLPAPDIEALTQGRTIVAASRMFLRPGQHFALYSDKASLLLPLEQNYRQSFLPIAKTVSNQPNSDTVLVIAWAKCELCEILDVTENFEALSSLTIWTTQGLQQKFQQQQNVFLAYLRVYKLAQPLEVPVNSAGGKIGKFVGLPQSLSVSEDQPVLSDRVFSQRRHQLENRLPPLHPELEELEGMISHLAVNNSSAESLNQHIRSFLGWNNDNIAHLDSDLVWIQKIAVVGNSSDGNEFEKLVRRSLIKLGFEGSGLNPDAIGGAGGMDFYAEIPFSIVGECKATKSERVPDGTPAQLLKIGMNHLGKYRYDPAIKLIVAAGELTFYALRTAQENTMNVIRPETLQRLVELQAQYKNSIDLLQLKKCLQQEPFGLADDKVNNYIDEIQQDIKVRSHLIEVVKQLGDPGSKYLTVEIRAHYNAVFAKDSTPKLDDQIVHDLLIELSSPLTGYLGRIKGSDWKSDRFYFLRDLPL